MTSWSKTEIKSYSPLKYEGYFLSFFWFLDLISILTLIPDIYIFAKPLGIAESSQAIGGEATFGKFVRLIRLLRLVRLYKILAGKRQRRIQHEEYLELVRVGAVRYDEMHNPLNNDRRSRLGTQLSQSTTQRVIIMVMIMVIIVPLIIYAPANEGPDFAIDLLNIFNINGNISRDSKSALANITVANLQRIYNRRYVGYLEVSPSLGDEPIVDFIANYNSLRETSKIDEFRSENIDGTTFTTRAIFNLRYLLFQGAINSILLTVVVAIIIFCGAVIFTADAQKLIIAPIERMMNMVEAVAANPLAQLEFDHSDPSATGEYETRLLEATVQKITSLLRVGFGEAGAGIISANLSTRASNAAINPLLPGIRIYAVFGFCDIHHFEEVNERLSADILTFVNTIAEIVHSNVHTWAGQCNKNLGNAFVIVWRIGDEDALRNSLNVNTALNFTQSKARGQSFNGIGSNLLSNGGAPSPLTRSRKINRLGSNDSVGSNGNNAEDDNKKKGTIDLRRIPGVDVLADKALIGYLKIIAQINRNKQVLKYRTEPRLTNNGTEEFKVRMGFGLHAGWAIEGAVGSLQKVDATYLSPHVNMAARLETSSKQYKVPLLASQDFYDLLSNEAQSYCRKLDVVTVKGSEVPIGIYTYDAQQEQQEFGNTSNNAKLKRRSSEMKFSFDGSNNDSLKAAAAEAAEKALNNIGAGVPPPASPIISGRRPSLTLVPGDSKPIVFLTPDDPTSDVFENDFDMRILRSHVKPEFTNVFKEAVTMYIGGDWEGAKPLFEKADELMREVPCMDGDGPSQTLLSYMQNRNFKPPKNWKGYRPLTSK